MQPKTDWKFSAPSLAVDLPRIVREAERAYYPAPAVIRVTVDNSALTLVHRSAFEGFLQNAKCEVVDRVLRARRLPVVPDTKIVQVAGDRGVVGYIFDPEVPEGDAEWILFLGDFVGAFTDRIEVKVEVF